MTNFFRVKFKYKDLIIQDFLSVNKEIKPSKEFFAKSLGINTDDVISFSKEFGKPKDIIKMVDLPMVLISLYSASLSGKNLNNSLTNTLQDLYNNKNLNNRMFFYIDRGDSLSFIFSRLMVDSSIVTLIESGERTGNISDSLVEANKFVSLNDKAKKASKSGLVGSLVYIGAAFAAILGIPVFMADIMLDIFDQTEKEYTASVELVIFIAQNVNIILATMLIITIIVLVSIFNPMLYNIVKKLPIYYTFYYLKQLKNMLLFLPIYASLNKSGINSKSIVEIYGGVNQKLSKQLLDSINNGNSISEAISNSEIPKSIGSHLSAAIAIESQTAKEKALAGVTDLVIVQIQNFSKKIAGYLSTTAFIILGGAVALIALSYFSMIEAVL